MHARRNRSGRWVLVAAMLGLLPLSLLSAQGQPALSAPLKVNLVIMDRHGQTTPTHTQTAHTAGGTTEVIQPRDDTLVITMTGVVTAGPHPFEASAAVMDFDLNQEFAVDFFDPKVKTAKLTVKAQVIGLLRGDKQGGSANVGHGEVAITSGGHSLLSLAMEGHGVSGEDNRAITDHRGPVAVPVLPGIYHLLQTFRISAAHVQSICGKAAAAAFAPDPALDPTWISTPDPFRGANKKEFGFRVTLQLEPE